MQAGGASVNQTINGDPTLYVSPDTFSMDVSQLEAAITSKTRVILPVHLFGQCVNLEDILAIAEKQKLYVVEDACQALGTDYIFSDGRIKKAGTMSGL